MSNFNQSKQNVGSQFNADKIGVTNNVVNNHIPPPLETIKAAWSTASQWFRSMLPATRRDYSSIVQFDSKHNEAMRRIEHERLELQRIDSSRRAYADNRLIQLKEEERRLQKEKFEWEKSVAQANLELLQNSQNIVREAQRKKLQSEDDRHYLKLRVSRDHIIKILSEDIGKFVVIPSPPEVLRDDLQAFKSLEAEVRPKLTRTIEKYYSGANQSVIGHRSSIFNASIGDSEALVVGEFIAPIPTLIFHSQVTHQKIFIWVTLTCPLVKKIALQSQTAQPQFHMQVNQKTFLLPEWNWMNLKREFEIQGQDHDTSSQAILDLISTIHLVVTLYFCDLYCLNLNPRHSPKLFAFLAEPDFPDGLQAWSQPLQRSLVETQNKIEEELKRIRTLETANLRQSNGGSSYTDFGDFFNAPVIASGIGLMLLLAMCSQQSPQMTGSNPGTQSSIEQSQSSKATSARIEVPISTGYEGANLRSAPKDGNEFIIGQVRNGEQVIAYEVSPNGQWRRVKLSDGRSGWVASNFVK
ncbi:MAG: SH3 domain-containing protein [Cyanobacteria bacterium CRU_2_1]|nr:SH3 domain-containing protein [Cyanobacteria bacterium CRU_2_1]